MEGRESGGCPRCAVLQQEIDSLKATVTLLAARVQELEAELARSKKDSSNSSKPPSSDIVKPPKPAFRGKRKRKQGAQPGHRRHERPLFAPEEIDTTWEYRWERCPDCGGHVQPSDQPPRTMQQVDIVPRPIEISEHRGMACYCPRCQKTHYALIDEPVIRAGLVGPHLTALVAYLKGACHCSFSTIRKFLRDVVCVTAIPKATARSVSDSRSCLCTPGRSSSAKRVVSFSGRTGRRGISGAQPEPRCRVGAG